MKATSAFYPGSEASVEDLIGLADSYYSAGCSAWTQADPKDPLSFAPVFLCTIQAVEIYLSAFLIFHGVDRRHVRGLQHDLARRTTMAHERGLCLRAKTQAHLQRITDERDYLVVRYGPEQISGLPQPNRMFATMKEVSTKVRRAILRQPYDHSDPRFRK